MTAKIYLDSHWNVGSIDRRIFGGFLEHLGRAVYEGVYDPASPHADRNGFRRDVIEALVHLRMPCIRYPGGNFVSAYDWTDGIGPKEQRPRRPEFAWRSIETNQFGTDEFVQWCRELKTEPMLAVNLGTGTIAAAAGLVEYANLPGGTYWADRRRANGHAEPHRIKLWCLGNEMDGPWQAGHVPAAVYAQRALQAARLMKGIDRDILTVACGSSGRGMPTYLQWDREVLEFCWDAVDFISAHRYSDNREGPAHFLAEGVEIDRILADYRGLLDFVRGLKHSQKRIYLSFDEWNVWYKNREMDGRWTVAPHLLEEIYNLEDALVCAQYLMSFLRHADLVKIACLAQITNVIAPILTRPNGLLIQSIYHPFEMISRLAHGVALQPAIDSPVYKAGSRGEVPQCDAAATLDPETGAIGVFVVNRAVEGELEVEVICADRRLTEMKEGRLLSGPDSKQANTWENPKAVTPTRASARLQDGKLHLRVPGPGFCAVGLGSATR